MFLSNLLPGVRELRAPLAAGYLWLLTIWLNFESQVPSEEGATGLWASFYRLADVVTPVGWALAVSFLAYLIGSLSEAFSDKPLRFISGLADVRLSRRGRRAVQILTNERMRTMAALLHGEDLTLDDFLRQEEEAQLPPTAHTDESDPLSIRIWFALPAPLADIYGYLIGLRTVSGDFPEPHAVLWQRVAAEMDRVATRLIGKERELFAAVDRLKQEAEFRFAVAPALLALVVTLAWADTPLWLLALIGVIGLYYQGIVRRRAGNDLLADALFLQRVDSPTLERLERAARYRVKEPVGA